MDPEPESMPTPLALPPAPQQSPPGPSEPSGNEDGRWAPIVVDVPIYNFEPKPPAVGPYRPDTFLDGWSTEDFTVRVASVRGYSHRYNGTPRQDEASVAIHLPSRAFIFAVADGVSSASQSHLGSATACRVAVDVLAWQLESGYQVIDWNKVVEATARELVRIAGRILRQEHPEPTAAEEIVATTLIAGCVIPSQSGAPEASMIQIGDSGAWVLQEGRYHSILRQKSDPREPLISSAVSALPRIPSPITPIEFQLSPDSVLLVGSDGFGDPLGDGEGHVGRLFAEHLKTPPPPRALAHLLDFSRETFDDDRTLVALWAWPPPNGRQ
jgi:serine/threonine protein phosphatase PrpC